VLGKLPAELCALIAPVFAQASSRFAAFAYVTALLTAPGTASHARSWASRRTVVQGWP